MSKQSAKFLRAILIGLVAGLVVLLAWCLGCFDSWEAPTWAWRAKFFAQRETPSEKIKLILLDQASLDWAKNTNEWGWPWPRELYTTISAFCKRGGARVLCLDMLYTEPSVYGVSDDEALGEALKQGPPSVLSIAAGASSGTWPDYMPKPDLQKNAPWIPKFDSMVFPVAEISKGASAAGHVAGLPDSDGVFPRILPFCRFDNINLPSLGLAGWLVANTDPTIIDIAQKQIKINNHTIPLDKHGNAILRFKGPSGLPEAFSAASVIQSELRLREDEKPVLSPEIFRDCYVFVGCSAPALLDLRSTPINSKCPGVVLHSTFVDNLITDSFIAEAKSSHVFIVVLLTAIAATISLTYGGRWFQALPLSIVWFGAPVLIGFAAYSRGVWWPIAAHETSIGLGLVGALTANYWSEGRQKAFIKQAFRHYLSGDVIEKIIRDPSHLQLGGEKRQLTIMFTDLAGFSTFSERLGPVELTTLLNDYLSEMTDIIMDEGGTLDKYEGDAIIAFWNAPLEQSDHAVRACRAALSCQRRLAELRDEFEKRTGAVMRMRVGLNTGDVVVGNMGSRKRFNYTILGDAANLASRLEGANKAFGTEMMISEATWNLTANEFLGRKLANLRVVGKKNAVTVYELTGFANEPEPANWNTFAEGLTCFQQGDFTSAKEIFEKLTNDPAAQHYVRRCARLCADPPKSWDGVWELTEK